MAQKPWIVPIPGTTQMPHMLENTGAAAVRFTPAEPAELNSSVLAIQVRGARLLDAVLVFSGVDAPPKKLEMRSCEQNLEERLRHASIKRPKNVPVSPLSAVEC